MIKKCRWIFLILNIIVAFACTVFMCGCSYSLDQNSAGSFDATTEAETEAKTEEKTESADAKNSSDKTAGEITDKTSDKTADKTTDKTSEKTSNKTSDKTIDKTSEKTSEKTSDKTAEKTTDKSSDNKTDISTLSDAESDVIFLPYSGEAYVEINGNMPSFTDEEKKSTEAFEKYSELDSLGRCGVAFANICPDIMPTEPRGDIGDVTPSGWHTVKYSDVIEDRYLYNRSHLIAYSLAGENSNVKNLITGTRYLNQETMQIFELKVLEYVRNTGNHVLYRVTPVFEGDNLLASGVQMEAWSVEDEGKSICFNVYCYNVQPHIEIDYATGESRVVDESQSDDATRIIDTDQDDKTTESTTEATTEATTEETTEATTEETTEETTETTTESTTETTTESTTASESESIVMDFVINTNTRKFHLPDCNSVADMAEHNKMEYTGTIEELKNMGYTPCKRCLRWY